VSGARAEVLLAHVAECEACGLTLRLASEALNEADASSDLMPVPARRWWPVVALIAAALTIVVGGLAWQPGREASAERLLAQAYTERRPFEFRLGDAEFAPVRVERSAGASRSKALLEAEVRTTQALAANPRDVTALQMRGRAEMLESEPASAVSTFRRALALAPGNAALLADLGAAYAQDGNWAAAHEALTEALRLDPKLASAVFNRALVNEKREAWGEAAADWERYLALDAASGWAREARGRLAGLRR